ncbi:MAG TPA: CoB--CoM heterodisulfide reductase iron-sulfur subunit B family protein [bacterium]|nr:CoB--CoM heterodisulfide reductase iron-sulfur subunit B family protein [bacterium]
MKMGYYPGCSISGSSREYGESLLAVLRALDVELAEVEDWNCCGASAAHNLNHTLSLALPARSLALAEQQGFQELLVPCAACFSRLAATRKALMADDAKRRQIADLVELPMKNIPVSINLLQLLQRVLPENLKEKLRAPFDYKVACYYGCLLVRPAEVVEFDREEDPEEMDRIMEKIGAAPLDWAFKTECCGAGFSVPRTDVVGRLCARILDDAVSRGAEAVIVACPMCHSNLDMRRQASESHSGKKYTIPILYVTQAIGLALGLDAKQLGLQRHIVPVRLSAGKSSQILENAPA